MKVAVMGLRHGHVGDLINRTQEHADLELVALCEENESAHAGLDAKYPGIPVFDDYEKMLAEVQCDIVGIGDYFAKRGQIAIKALEHGKHVLSDKPLCTSLEELDTIEKLAAEKRRVVGCMLDLRDGAPFQALLELARSGELGTIRNIGFGGQHMLSRGTRPGWYFEEGKHGGTLTDIAIHAIDFIPALTGQRIKTVNAARCWNARLPEVPWFKEAGQLMLTLEDGCGVLGDVSYLLPDDSFQPNPLYWRTTLWGDKGVAETHYGASEVVFYKSGETSPVRIAADKGVPGGYLEAFLSEINGQPTELTSQSIFRSMRAVLTAQKAADQSLTNVEID